MKTIHIIEDTLPVAWEKSVIECWRNGDSFPTQYDKDGDSNSKDVTVMIHILHPMKEPRIHRAFPGGLDDLEKYRNEVLFGVHDHWIDPEAGKWEYTYHERLFDYDTNAFAGKAGVGRINQIDLCIKMLKECEHTRRAQAVTWQAWKDLGTHDATCLQRLWFRVQKQTCPVCHGDGEISHGLCSACEGTGERNALNMNVHFRSNDAYKAAFMNMYAFIELQAYVADKIGVPVGEYIHIADSYHIYGSYFDEFKGFLNVVDKREPEDRVYESKWVYDFFLQGCDTLLAEEDLPDTMKEKVLERKEDINAAKAEAAKTEAI